MTILDRECLEQEFNLDGLDENEVEEIIKSVNEDPIDDLKNNSARANFLLDYIEREITNGNLTPRLAEVAGQLINTVTNTNKEIISHYNYNRYLQIREKMLELKQLEIELKNQKNNRSQNQNIIVTDRESVLKMLEQNTSDDEKEEKEDE